MSDPPEPLQFVASDEIERRQIIWADFLEHILGLPWAFVSNQSRLADFEGLHPRSELEQRVESRYGLQLQTTHFEMPLYKLLDYLRPPLQA